ncbi:replication-relaxation family protein [Streptomyces sp. NPDC058268]|uniref:replication-relaxation family protein n=1 Tax=Streptomyces sp. NPDC058268 TaxID=3346413 RepID=UPI0036E99AF9
MLRSHLAFVADARRRGDEHSHLDWTLEVSHPLGDGERLIADALAYYVAHQPDGTRIKLRALVEVDRATTSSERLATKLIDYARLHTYTRPPAARPTQRRPGSAGIRSSRASCSSSPVLPRAPWPTASRTCRR